MESRLNQTEGHGIRNPFAGCPNMKPAPERYGEMRSRFEKELNRFSRLFIFWAFSKERFMEGLKKLDIALDGSTGKVIDIGYGGYCRSEKVKDWRGLLDRQQAELAEAIKADATGEGFILEALTCELANHEYCVTWDAEPALNALGLGWDDVAENPALSNGLATAMKKCRDAA